MTSHQHTNFPVCQTSHVAYLLVTLNEMGYIKTAICSI